MDLLIPGAMLAAGVAMLVRVVTHYRQGNTLNAIFWLLVIITLVQIGRPR